MKIVISAYTLRVAGGMSVGKNIIKTLPQIAPEHEYLMVVPANCDYPTFENNEHVTVISCPLMPILKREFSWARHDLKKILADFHPDWVWCLGNTGFSWWNACRQSVLIHNPHWVYPMNHVDFGSSWKLFLKHRITYSLYMVFLRKSYVNVNRFYCQTDVMKERFAKRYHVPEDNIFICPNSISYAVNRNHVETEPTLEKYGNRFKLFCLAKCYAQKNMLRIVKMYDRYREELKDTVCILTINRDDYPGLSDRILDLIHEKKLDDQIISVGRLDQEQLQRYYNSCDALFFPTLLESFSATYLEAMNFNSPVITSNLDFAHGICGDAALYVDPFSLESMKNGILQLKNDKNLYRQLQERGQKRKGIFMKSWEDILRNVCDIEGIRHL
ncbi:MAG: glycosyltransferase [Thermoguttaceae bacterium]|nr:glycosyltransferase [Thermoguttaceae bacterium]